MIILGAIAAASFVLGVIILVNKNALAKLEALMNKPVINTAGLKYNHKLLGLLLIIFAGVLVYIALSLKR